MCPFFGFPMVCNVLCLRQVIDFSPLSKTGCQCRASGSPHAPPDWMHRCVGPTHPTVTRTHQHHQDHEENPEHIVRIRECSECSHDHQCADEAHTQANEGRPAAGQCQCRDPLSDARADASAESGAAHQHCTQGARRYSGIVLFAGLQ